MWCKWSRLAIKGSFLFFNLIKLIDKNSKTNNDIDHASKIWWAKFWLAEYINTNDIINPKSKLPLSPKNSFGSLKIEKLKNKKIQIGMDKVIKNNWSFWSETKKYKIANTEIEVKTNVPSAPSK